METSVNFEIRGLNKSYGGRRVLDIPELTLGPGQFVALMGPNGSGKSTLMRLLAQQDTFEAGSITYGATSLASPTAHLNQRLVFVAEDHALPFARSIAAWADVWARQYAGFDRATFDRLRASLALDVTKAFQTLSRGQRAQALFTLGAAQRPEVYVLDEITAVLDVGARLVVMDHLKAEAARGCCVLMSTNIAAEMQGFATDVIFLENGRVHFRAPARGLDAHFVKVRVAPEREPDLPAELDARRVGLNADGRWSYLYPRGGTLAPPAGVTEADAREITLAEVQAYFTTGRAA